MSVEYDATKLAAARLHATALQPYLATALWALVPVVARGLGTFAVDRRWRLYLDPDALARWDTAEVAGVLLHEVHHVLRDHASRGESAGVDEHTSMTWNIAGDAEINDDLLRDGIRLPSPVTPKTLSLPASKTAEFYFARLLKARVPPHLDHVACGPGATGVDDARLVPPLGAEGVSDVEAELIRRQVAQAVRAAGNAPGGLSRWAEATLEPVIDWRRVLAASLRSGLSDSMAGRVDYPYRRPARRRVPGVVLPAMVAPRPVVAVVVDTSGSVTDTELHRAWTEVVSAVRSIGVSRRHLVVWATDVEARRVDMTQMQRVDLTGGGGTDMGVGIAAAQRQRPRPDVIVVITDGETPWPVDPPPMRVVVALFDRGTPVGSLPSWASVITVPAG